MCDNHRLLLEAMVNALAQRGFTIEAATSSPAQAMVAVELYDPDLLITDLTFPGGGSALDLVRQITRAHSRTKVLILTRSDDTSALLEAMRLGVAGYLRTDLRLDNIVATLKRIEAGSTEIDPGLLRRLGASTSTPMRSSSALDALTPQEQVVLECLVDGMRTNEIVERLGISTSTVRTHVQSVLLKLGVHSRLQAVAVFNSTAHDEAFPA